jgi:hypothetical protein
MMILVFTATFEVALQLAACHFLRRLRWCHIHVLKRRATSPVLRPALWRHAMWRPTASVHVQ